jgi:hypothetical protein
MFRAALDLTVGAATGEALGTDISVATLVDGTTIAPAPFDRRAVRDIRIAAGTGIGVPGVITVATLDIGVGPTPGLSWRAIGVRRQRVQRQS